jgi:hypothetical protein
MWEKNALETQEMKAGLTVISQKPSSNPLTGKLDLSVTKEGKKLG